MQHLEPPIKKSIFNLENILRKISSMSKEEYIRHEKTTLGKTDNTPDFDTIHKWQATK